MSARTVPAAPALAETALPRRLRDWRGRHAGETVVVCGCGRSLTDLPQPERLVTVGVNDVGRLFEPTYLVVLNPRSQFRGDRFAHVERSRARALFTQLDLGLSHPCVVRFRLGRRGGTGLDDPDRLPYTRNSPYVAVCLAALMGARRIGLVGVDFTDHHFFAATGRHPLARELAQIDGEYGDLAAALARRGVELVNLSRQSRLTRLPKVDPATFLAGGPAVAAPTAAVPTTPVPATPVPATPVPATTRPATAAASAAVARRVFFVHYRYLHCGDVFERGLEGAARSLGIPFAGACCNDPRLPDRVAAFAPDLLFVVHGRTFRQRWARRFDAIPSAVWLTDEPYEVDDTEATSALFDTVFLNDPSTLDRHPNAHYLPMAWDPALHHPGNEPPCWDAGFVGGADPHRERCLDALAEAGLLSYVVGGPWRSRRLRALCRAARTTPQETAELYRRTRVVVNLFRARHHFNRRGVAPWSLNPRVYEALACGALVVSEARPELAQVFPGLPGVPLDGAGSATRAPGALVAAVAAVLGDEDRRLRLLGECRRELPRHTYAARLERALELAAAAPPGRHEEPDEEERSMAAPKSRRRRGTPAPAAIHRLEHRGPIVPGRVTVVVPVFDCPEEFLDRSLASIRAQDHPGELELVVVDDGSAPRYRVAETARRHGVDHLIRLPRNLGACAARNVGWLSGQGETTLFFDADDVLAPSAVRTMDETLRRHPEAALCYSDFTVDGERFAAGPFELDTLRRRNRVAIASLVRTREFVGFDERIPRGMDWDAWLRMLKLGKRGVKAPGVLFHVTTARAGRISTTVSWSRLQQAMRHHHPDLLPAAGPAATRASARAAARAAHRAARAAHRAASTPAAPAPRLRRARPGAAGSVPARGATTAKAAAAGRTIVTAVVVYHNSQPWFEVLLESLLQRRFTADPQRVHLRVLLVENPCQDDSPRIARAFCDRFGANAAILPSGLRRDRAGGGANHAHGLEVGLRHVKPDSEWTLFLDADVVLLRDGWLDDLLALGADVAGPPAFAHLADYDVPHAHPSFLLFRTRLGRPPVWTGGFGPRRDPAGGGELDTAIAFTMALGRRPDVRLVRLPQERLVAGGLEHYRIADLALHLRGVSNLPSRPARYSAKHELLALPPVAELLAAAEHRGALAL